MATRGYEEPIDIDFYADRDGASNKKITYFYDSSIGNYYYGRGHCMKPHRVKMVHALVMEYQLYKNLTVMRPPVLPVSELTRFHSDDYVSFLRNITTDNMFQYKKQLRRFNMVYDCPVFDGLIDFCQLYTSGSIGGAARLNHGLADIAINWAGGLHHAKKNEASGFCYINDCVLGILELLKKHNRVLYIDIDIHHGDGVEEAFYSSNRVMTCSFHKYGRFFPGTGALEDTGIGAGKGYSVNVPFHEGITDRRFFAMFRSIIGKINERFRPEAICLQCGADSLNGDKLGCFNLTLNGHAACVDYVRSLNVPVLVLGGGGYTMRNVARCWVFETAVLTGRNVENAMPHNKYFEYYGPDYMLHIQQSNMPDLNTPKYLSNVVSTLHQQLDDLVDPVPGVQILTGQAGGSQRPAPMFLKSKPNPTHSSSGAFSDNDDEGDADVSESDDGEDNADDQEDEDNGDGSGGDGEVNDENRESQ